jgi:hypothetical protein
LKMQPQLKKMFMIILMNAHSMKASNILFSKIKKVSILSI